MARHEPEGERRELPVKPMGAGSTAVSFRIQRIEHRLLWAYAAYALWFAIVLYASQPSAWLLAALALVLGWWSRYSPPRRASQLAMRAALLLCVSFFAEAGIATLEPPAAGFALALLLAGMYTLLLPLRWCIALWALAAIDIVAVHAASPFATRWPVVMAQAGSLAAVAYAAFEYARGAGQADLLADAAGRDRSSRLYNEAGFFIHGGELFEECRRQKRPFSLVLMEAGNLRDVFELAGRKAANQVFAQLVQVIDRSTPAAGIAARTDTVEFAMALPGVNGTRAAALLHHKLGQPARIEVTLGGSRFVVMLGTVIGEAGPEIASLEDLYDRVRSALHRRTAEAGASDFADLSTPEGMLQPGSVVPTNERPTLPMDLLAQR